MSIAFVWHRYETFLVNTQRSFRLIFEKGCFFVISLRESAIKTDNYFRNCLSSLSFSRDDCECGHAKSWHVDRNMDVSDEGTHIWHQKTHTEEGPCDSFGQIHFRGFGTNVLKSPVICTFKLLLKFGFFSFLCDDVVCFCFMHK